MKRPHLLLPDDDTLSVAFSFILDVLTLDTIGYDNIHMPKVCGLLYGIVP